MLTMQDALARLAAYWADHGCLTIQPMNTEVGAGTLNPATFLRVLGPEPWRVAYVEPSVRPDDARYGENPNRIQTHTQFQVILKPEPGDAQELYLGSLAALGIDTTAHDVRFVEDNWASPALGAWGVGWEVWLDGLEITQFTYFQQAGGITLDIPSVEITYGVERILMALQNVTHFKDITYAPGITYGEVFGQAEYEMSRYYLDDADLDTNRRLLSLYAAEAQRMLDAKLPVPAHSYVLKCSHAFNVLDARGAVSTSERAAEFARMRRLAGEVAQLWLARRAELDHPLGTVAPLPPATPPAPWTSTGTRLLAFEIGTEELPPAEARLATEQLRRELTERLAATRLAHGDVTVHATPRRLVALVTDVAAREEDFTRTLKGPKTTAAFDASGNPTRAAEGFARAQGVAVADLERVVIDGVEHLGVRREEAGRPAGEVLAGVLRDTVTALRSAKNMRWSDPSLAFTRAIRWLLALWGNEIVPLTVSSLAADRLTRVHRDAAEPVVSVPDADRLLPTLAAAGIVLNASTRRAEIVESSAFLASEVDGRIVGEERLVDQIVYLVEQPSPLLGSFDPRYLELPEAVLATVMRKHQRYLPVRGADGHLLPHFVAVANGTIDPDVVRAGNEAVLRARYEDAAFFYRADRATPLTEMRDRLRRLTFTDKLGSMADRADRIAALALELGASLDNDARETLEAAAELVKFDLGSRLVTEMTSLAGIMARDYAAHAGQTAEVAQALHEVELPRQAGDDVPATTPGALLSLADRLDLLCGLAATVGLPTGSSDPFALRRAALGLIATHRANHLELSLVDGLRAAAQRQPVPVDSSTVDAIADFLAKRLEQQLTEEGHPIDRVRAVLPHAPRPAFVDQSLVQLAALVDDPRFRGLAEALGRARRIVPSEILPGYDVSVLTEPAELALHEAVSRVVPSRDLVSFVDNAGAIVGPVNEFFDAVFVMVDEPSLRQARLGLLATVRDVGAGILDWDQLRL